MDAKKKKNRKKKGSQSKITEDATTSAEAVSVQEQNHSSATEQNHHAQNSGIADVQSAGVSESDIELEKHKIYEEKFVKLHEEIRQLADEKNSWLEKQVNLEEKIKVLQNEVDCCSQKEACFEAKLNDLQIGNDSVIQKEVILEDRVRDMESIKDIWVLKETLIREMITRLEEANISLQMQVKGLEESRSNMLQENQHLVENISGLESRIQCLEREASFCATSKMEMTQSPEEIKPFDQIEAANSLIQMPDSGNGEVAGKVTEQDMQSNQHAASAEHSSHVFNHEISQAGTSTDYVPQFGEQIQPSVGIQERFSPGNGVVDSIADPGVRSAQPPGLDEPRTSEDIISVPLDEIQIHEEVLQGRKNVKKPSEIPLSDAPLTGAPFRLISFVTKYVSGADLVK